MIKYLVNKLLLTFGVLFSVTMTTFLLTFVVPSDPARALLGIHANEESAQALRSELKLDQPFLVQYWEFLKRLSKWDLGRSYITNQEVKSLIADRIPATIKLTFFAIIFAAIMGILLGIFSVYLNSKVIHRFLISGSIISASIPVFFLAIIASLFIGSYLKILPISGYETGWGGVKYLILPGIVLSIYPFALIARIVSSKLWEIMESDYIRTHYAMGFNRLKILLSFALKNAMIPILSVIGNMFALLISGAFFVEYIFSWPGIGLLMVDSILRYDFPVIIGIVMFSSVSFVIITTMVDLLYPLIDPRIRRT